MSQILDFLCNKLWVCRLIFKNKIKWVITFLHNCWLGIENWEMLILMMKNQPNDHKLNYSCGCKSIDGYHANEDGVVL